VAERLLATEVTPVPTVWHRYRWLWLALIVVLLILLAVLGVRLRARREARKVRGLSVLLYAAGGLQDQMAAPNPDRRSFRFVVHRHLADLELQPASAGEPESYEVRRSGAGVSLLSPGGQRTALSLNARRRIKPDVEIAVVDSGATGPITGPDGDGGYDPFHGMHVTTPLPGRAEPATEPVLTPPVDPFPSAPADPYSGGLPTGADPYEDPNNPFR
jgi:hypothetical protein